MVNVRGDEIQEYYEWAALIHLSLFCVSVCAFAFTVMWDRKQKNDEHNASLQLAALDVSLYFQ